MSVLSVYKFGGSSVADPERIGKVIEILLPVFKNGEKPTVVFSAFGGVTDTLITMSKMAVQGDSNYLEILNLFEERHLHAIDLLISKDKGLQVAANVYHVTRW